MPKRWVTAFTSDLPALESSLVLDSGGTPARHRRIDLAGLIEQRRRVEWMWTGAAPAHRPRQRERSSRQHRHLLAERLFRNVLTRERKRADRFGDSLVLLLLEMKSAATTPMSVSDRAWIACGAAVNAAVGETAVIGWFETAKVLGAILPEVCGSDPEALVRRELVRRLEAGALAQLSIQSHVYSQGSGHVEPRRTPDPFLVERRSADPRRTARHVLKRGLDLAGSLVLLAAFSPLLLVIAALLKLTSPGPVLFRQKRIGEMGKPFTMLKFRTMHVGADPSLHQAYVTKFIKSGAELRPAGKTALFKLTNDPRTTPLGRILRKTSLDELPQLWNVLRGEMSLVGPRPPLDYEVAQYQSWHWRRVLESKPGVTGLWQVVGRSRTTFDDMVRIDLRYVRHASLWTDIKILLATPRAVMSRRGAG